MGLAGRFIWLGGTLDDRMWKWSDGAAWSYENWGADQPDIDWKDGEAVRHLVMGISGEWFRTGDSNKEHFVCRKY